MKAKGNYTVKKWDEKTYEQVSPDQKMTRASVQYEFSGEIEGKGSVEYLMFYRHDDPKDQHKSTASYVGLIRFEGKLTGRSGSFVMTDNGTFAGGTASSALKIQEGSGRESLAGIKGAGKYEANMDGFWIELEYDLI